MAIIKCPKCRRTISDEAGICVHCACLIDNSRERAEREYHRNISRTVILIIASGIYIVLYAAIFSYVGWANSLWGVALFLVLYLTSFYFIFHTLRERAWIATKIFSPLFLAMAGIYLIGQSDAILSSHFYNLAVPAIIAACHCLSIWVLIRNVRKMRDGEYELTPKAFLKEEKRLLKQFTEDAKSQN